MSESQVSIASILEAVTRERLLDLARVFGVRLTPRRDGKQGMAAELGRMLGRERVGEVLDELGRDELRAVCRAHGLADRERTRDGLIAQIAAVADVPVVRERGPVSLTHGELPVAGQVVAARGRQWLVEDAIAGGRGESPLLRLACLDDDAQGRRLELLWDLELGARVIAPELEGLGAVDKLDAPAHFGAYLHALKWSAVGAADATRFQAPFRAGIKLMAHQLTPLMKALELPRANLFIADDVGLGKTIEAGLVVQELILRQRAEFILVVCPAAICLQWRDEMLRRFGLRFEVMSRNFIARRRVERGFGVNPWSTHNRFIVSFGSRISSRALNEFECPLCGVALRNKRLSKRGARSRTARVVSLSTAYLLAEAGATTCASSRTSSPFSARRPRWASSRSRYSGRRISGCRLYLGVAAPGRALRAVSVRAYATLLAAAARHFDADGAADQAADPYMTLVGYFNSLRELGGMRRLVEDEVRTRVRQFDADKRPVGSCSRARANASSSPAMRSTTHRTYCGRCTGSCRSTACKFGFS